jgi:putative NADH-flavin reductase
MVLTVFGATGMVGNAVVEQALSKGFIVKAFGRNIEKLLDSSNMDLISIKGYVFDEEEVYHAIQGSNAVISALGGAFDGSDKSRSLGVKNIVKQMQKANVQRIIVVGSTSVLNADPTHLYVDLPDFTPMYLPVGLEHKKAYEYLKESSLDWTMVCPPEIVNQTANGKYVTNADYVPEPNYKKVFTGNLASFMLNELTENKYVKQRVGISNIY